MKIYIIQFINYTLSFFMWMIVGRIILTLIIGNGNNVIMGLFAKVTDPVYRLTKKIVPFAGERWIPLISIVLIISVRLLLIIMTGPAGVQK